MHDLDVTTIANRKCGGLLCTCKHRQHKEEGGKLGKHHRQDVLLKRLGSRERRRWSGKGSGDAKVNQDFGRKAKGVRHSYGKRPRWPLLYVVGEDGREDSKVP